jgi:hypothetical protein
MTQAPAWLTGGYVHRAPSQTTSASVGGGGTGGPSSAIGNVMASGGALGSQAMPAVPSVETWCRQRLDAIADTAAGGDSVPELKRFMERLEVTRFAKHRETLKKIRSEKWTARKRSTKAYIDLFKFQRDVIKIDAQAAHIDAKIARLRSYSRFIEMCWQDDALMDAPAPSSESPGEPKSSNGSKAEKLDSMMTVKQEINDAR